MALSARYDTAEVRAAVSTVMARMTERQSEVARNVHRELATEIVDLREDPALLDLLGASVAGNIDTIFRALRHEIPIESIEPPTAALEYARRLAQRGVPMHALVRAYRLGHGSVLATTSEEVNNAGLDPPTCLATFEYITAATFRYIDWVTQQVVMTYEQERDRWLANRNSAREMRVREVLHGGDSNPDSISTAIGYPMRRTHLALTLWLPDDDPLDSVHDDTLVRLERLVRDLGECLHAAGALFVPADRLSGWGWLALSTESAPTAVEAIRQHIAKCGNAPSIALGAPLSGVEGFRRSHRQAQRVRELVGAARGTGASVTATTDPGVAAAALLTGEPAEARNWVREVLGPLAGETDSDARLRDTLRVYLRHGGSYKAAATELGLHYNSVKYRVARAVERRGRPIGDDRLDVELALLVCQRFGVT